MNRIDSELNPTMAAHRTFDSILQQIQFSNLNFRIQLTPFAANISLKKTPVRDKSGIPLPVDVKTISCDVSAASDVTTHRSKNVKLEKELSTLKHEYSEQLDRQLKNIQALTQKNQELLSSRDHANETIANLVEEKKLLKDTIEGQNVRIKELETANKTKKEITDKLNKNLNDLKVKFNKEKIELSKKHKGEVKYWRKELGEETKIKIKLLEQLQDEENNAIVKASTAKNKLKKKALKSASTLLNRNSNPSTTFCSICSLDIPKYVPEYFCGEKYNPTCESCKNKDYLDDIFSSFSSPQQPLSLVSHWLVPFGCPPPQNPNSITSLLSHCVNMPNQVDEKLNDEAERDDFKEWIADFREQLKADRIKFMADLRKDFSSLNLS